MNINQLKARTMLGLNPVRDGDGERLNAQISLIETYRQQPLSDKERNSKRLAGRNREARSNATISPVFKADADLARMSDLDREIYQQEQRVRERKRKLAMDAMDPEEKKLFLMKEVKATEEAKAAQSFEDQRRVENRRDMVQALEQQINRMRFDDIFFTVDELDNAEQIARMAKDPRIDDEWLVDEIARVLNTEAEVQSMIADELGRRVEATYKDLQSLDDVRRLYGMPVQDDDSGNEEATAEDEAPAGPSDLKQAADAFASASPEAMARFKQQYDEFQAKKEAGENPEV
jgi:hypothetical protein